MAAAPSSTVGISFRVPPNVPMAVRTGSTITTECFDLMRKGLRPDDVQETHMANWRAMEDYDRAVLAIMLILARNDAIKLEYHCTRRRRRHRPFLANLLRSSDVGMPPK